MECESINKETPEMKQLISGIQKEGASLITPPTITDYSACA
ncbi:hypothetical protein [Bacteroides pyogenes]|nr:hypothetical protein [Bacteroides pyogenes]